MMRILRPLDRYVFSEFWKIFVVTALGFPLLIDHHRSHRQPRQIPDRHPAADIALSYVYCIPDSMFIVLPAAVLFATVFSIGALTRHRDHRGESVGHQLLSPDAADLSGRRSRGGWPSHSASS